MCALPTETDAASSALPIQTGEEDIGPKLASIPRRRSTQPPPLVALPAQGAPPAEPEAGEERRRQAELWNKVKRLFVPPMPTLVRPADHSLPCVCVQSFIV